jgi:hypothetical protein
MQHKCWSTTNETAQALKYPLCCPTKSRPGELSQRGPKCCTPATNRKKLKGSRKTPAKSYYKNPSLQPIVTPLVLEDKQDIISKTQKQEKAVARSLHFEDVSVVFQAIF